jgi:hypothetical protein
MEQNDWSLLPRLHATQAENMHLPALDAKHNLQHNSVKSALRSSEKQAASYSGSFSDDKVYSLFFFKVTHCSDFNQ